MRALSRLVAVCFFFTALFAAPPAHRAARPEPPAPSRAPEGSLRFEPNVGQADGRVRFTARGRDGAVSLGDADAALRVGKDVVRIRPVGAREGAAVEGLEPLSGTTNYFRGADPSRWRAGVPGFARVRYTGVYEGVDLVYYGNGGRLEYDFVVSPGADPGAIRLRFDGARSLEVDAAGDLRVKTDSSELRQRAPRLYQQTSGGVRTVAGAYTIVGRDEAAFAVGAFDPSLPLVVDPEVVFSTYLGGSDSDDGRDIAVDASGAVYVVGTTTSIDFPVAGAFQGDIADPTASDAFVVKLSADGGSIVYATYLGGDATETGSSIAVDASGAVYVAGSTYSTNFPVSGAYQIQSAGGADSFVAKLSASGGALVYSTYYGGQGDDFVADMRLRADGAVAFGGRTTSKFLPVVSPFQDVNRGGTADGFVVVLAATGASLENATFAGGNGDDQVDSVVFGLTNAVYASGVSASTNFATCQVGDETEPRSFILVAAGAAPITPYTFPCEPSSAIAACPMTGGTTVSGFQLRALAGGGSSSLDVRAVTVEADLDFVRERIFGGMGQDYPDALTIGADGSMFVVGDTDSEDFPTLEPTQPTFGGFVDVFVTTLAAGTDQPTFSTYLGGTDVEFPTSIATDADGNIYVTGVTFSSDFPTSPGALQSELSGLTDAFVVKIGAPPQAGPDFAITPSASTITLPRKGKMQVTMNVARTGGFTGSVTVRPPDTRAIKVKITPASVPTPGDTALFSIKVKKKATPGTYPLVFTATDAENRVRTTTVMLVIQ